MKKRTFLLLEVLIAFLLVAICAIPLVKQPLKLYRKEMAHLKKMELERIADWTFSEIKEILLKNEIPWDKLPTKGKKSARFPLPPATLEIPTCGSMKVERAFQLTGRAQKTGVHEEEYRQLGVYVFLNQEKYTFRIPVQKVFVE